MHIVRFNRYPNNEVRVTHYYKAARQEKPQEAEASQEIGADIPCASGLDGEAPHASPLNLTLATNSDSGESNLPFRRTKFGRNAKNTLLRIGGAYDTLSHEPSDFLFLTGTLPGNTPAAFRCVAEYSSYIAESIAHWLKRTVKSEHYFYVWELQKRGALHFHYCIYCPDKSLREKTLLQFKPKWTTLLDDISTRSGVCLWESAGRTCWADRYGVLQAYAQPVHTSVAAYLSGYLAGDKNKHAQDESSPYYPRRWWGASRKSTSLLKSLTEEVTLEYPSYRSARHRIDVHYEAVLDDTPHAHHYQHKVGVGSTVVSYHPEDKGHEIWQGLQKMTLTHKHHPHIASLIHVLNKAAVMAQPYIAKQSHGGNIALKALLLDLQDSVIWQATRRWTLQDIHLRILRDAKLHLPTPTSADHHLLELLRILALTEEFLTLNQGLLTFNRYGWLCNYEDVPYTVDFSKAIVHISTTESDRPDAQEGAANGSLSPQNPLFSLEPYTCF